MASFEQQFATALLRRLGQPITKPAVKNLIGWMKAEGGHTHNSARWNPLNTTQNMPGSGDTGSQGNISVFRNFNQGVEATVRTLRNGRYNAILTSLNADPSTFARSVNATPWGTKRDFSPIIRSASVSGDFARSAQSAGAPVARDPGAAPSSSAPGSLPQLSSLDASRLMALLNSTERGVLQGQAPGEGYSRALSQIAQAMMARAAPVAAARQVGASVGGTADAVASLILKGAIPGSPIPGQRPHASTHPTSGLAGYPAFDYMAPAGTKVAAPVGGKIIKLSGKDPRLGGSPGGPLGYSIYLQGRDGRTYFMTHIDKVKVRVGQKVRQGQQLAVVAAGPSSWSSPHVHQGVRG